MKLRSPIEVAKDLYQVPAIGARVTVLATDDGVVMVDAGSKGSLRLIKSGLDELGISLDSVRLIVLTHYHPDHSGGLRELVDATSAEVAVHGLEAEIISGGQPHPSPHRNRILAGVLDPFIARMYGGPVSVEHVLEDRDQLPGSESVVVVHTPGHTKGSICLLVPSSRTLIVGDALQYRFRRLSPPAKAVTADPEQALESLIRLMSLDFDTICFSHFNPIQTGAKDALERLVRKSTSSRPMT